MSDAPRPINSQLDIYRKLLPLLPEDKAARILDAGAGQGFFSRLMRDEGYRGVAACDYLAGDWKCPEVPFVAADLNEAFPFADESFDCVVTIEVIEHVKSHFHFMDELARVTRRGGRIVITTPNYLAMSGRWHFLLYGYNDCAPLPIDPAGRYFMEHTNPISLPQILFHLERVGAELEELRTNRLRKGSLVSGILLYPLLNLALRAKLLRKKFALQHALHRRHLRWMLHPNTLLGRTVIAVARRR
jgi:2-polyprenyl-3-methyl-5-hydroxy-6-metoxy-1,4-benzoquinol methylase